MPLNLLGDFGGGATYLVMGILAIEPAFYARLLDGLGLEDDPAAQNDRDRWPGLRRRTADAFATRTRQEWTDLFAETDACVAPVLSLAEAPRHPHVAARAASSSATVG